MMWIVHSTVLIYPLEFTSIIKLQNKHTCMYFYNINILQWNGIHVLLKVPMDAMMWMVNSTVLIYPLMLAMECHTLPIEGAKKKN